MGYRLSQIIPLRKEGTRDIYFAEVYSSRNGWVIYKLLGEEKKWRGYRSPQTPEGYEAVPHLSETLILDGNYRLRVLSSKIYRETFKDSAPEPVVAFNKFFFDFPADIEEYVLHLEKTEFNIGEMDRVPVKVNLIGEVKIHFAWSCGTVKVIHVKPLANPEEVYKKEWGPKDASSDKFFLIKKRALTDLENQIHKWTDMFKETLFTVFL